MLHVVVNWEPKSVLHVVENWDGVQLAVVALADDWRTPYSPTEQLEQHQFSQLAGKQENHTVLTSSDQSRRISKRMQNLENAHISAPRLAMKQLHCVRREIAESADFEK